MQRSFLLTAIVGTLLVSNSVHAQTTGASQDARGPAVADEALGQAAQQAEEAVDQAAEHADERLDAAQKAAPPSDATAPANGAVRRANAQGRSLIDNQPPRPRDPVAPPNTSAAARRTLTPEQLRAGLQFGQATREGLPLATVAPDSFLYDRGLRTGDVVVSYGGQPIRTEADFSRLVTYEAGQRVPVVVVREGRPQTVFLVYDADGPLEWHAGTLESESYLGITFEPSLNQPATVAEVAPISPAEDAGVRPGDVVSAINGRAVANWRQVAEVVSAFKPGADLEISITRPIKVAARPNATPTAIVTPRVNVIPTPVPPAP